MVEPPETILDEREELMVSPYSDRKPTLRNAHFIKPSLTSVDGPVAELPSTALSFATNSPEHPKLLSLRVTFDGWRGPQKDWEKWIDRLRPRYQSTWKEVGIYEAIMNSTYEIRRKDDLILGIAERWCPDTNTFVFPWGEATITLEDMVVLGGYSVIGDPLSIPLENEEGKKIEEKLIQVRLQITRTKAQKPSQSGWTRHFMEIETEFEHEAFLSLWLSRFVFPKYPRETIGKHVFPIAIHLARGKRIAFAPTVLANIYKDFRSLKEAIVASKQLGTGVEDKGYTVTCTLWTPFQLVQIWVWERFVSLSPKLKGSPINYGEARWSRWCKVKLRKYKNVRRALDTAGEEDFKWRPYNWPFNEETQGWISIFSSDLDRDLLSFAQCLKVCELVGTDDNCIEQYLPHRVAMQFGMDQDMPCHVPRYNKTREMAWKSYIKLIGNAKLYIRPPLFKPGVTTRYLKWWKQFTLGGQGSSKGVAVKHISPKSLKSLKCGLDVPPGFPPKVITVDDGDSDVEDKTTILEMLKSREKQKGVLNKLMEEYNRNQVLKKTVEQGSSDEEDKITILEMLKPDEKNQKLLKASDSDVANKPNSDDGNPLLETQSQILSYSMVGKEDDIMDGEYAKEGSEKSKEDWIVSTSEDPVYNREGINNNEAEGSSHCTLEIPGLQLEARIRKLEKAVAVLKAERFRQRTNF